MVRGRAIRDWFLQRFWLSGQEERARSRTVGQQADAKRAFAEARRWHAAARELSRPRTMPAAVPLYWQALVRFAVAYGIGHATTGPPAPRLSEALDLLADPLRREGLADSLDQVVTASHRSPDDPPEDARAQRSLLSALERVTCAARRAAQAPTLRAVSIARVLRVTLSVSIVLALSIALVHWIRAPRNVARGKHIFASSIAAGQPELLVNGAIEWGMFAFHSQQGSSYVDIDLGREYDLVEARIYNRGDGYLDESVPLDIALSTDGRSYATRARCTEFFSQATPCRVSLEPSRARYVRVSCGKHIALSEIEVMGR